MKNILVLNGHPNPDDSTAGKAVLEAFRTLRPDAKVRTLAALCGSDGYDVAAEQARLLKADVVVLQFPIFWYSAPSLLERWMEETFVHGFSHGRTGDKLSGKKLVLSITTGAPEALYAKDGPVGFALDDFLACFKATCRLCRMEYAGEIHTCGVSYASRTSEEQIESQNKASTVHAERLVELLKSL